MRTIDLKSIVAISLSISMLGIMPNAGVAEALGQVVAGKVVAAPGAGVAAPVGLPVRGGGASGLSLDIGPASLKAFTPGLSAPTIGVAARQAQAGNAVVPAAGLQAAEPVTVPAVSRAVPAVAHQAVSREGRGAPGAAELGGMKDELILDARQLERMADDDARASGAAVMDRILGIKAVAGGGDVSLAMPDSASRSKSRSKSGSRRGMPVEDDRIQDSGPDGTDGLDDLGNPARRQDDGPDSVSDEFGGGGRGGSELFSPGLSIPQVGMLNAARLAAPGSSADDAPVDLVVMLSPQGERRLTADSFLSAVGLDGRQGVQAYAAMQESMLLQLESFGLGADTLFQYEAAPKATIQRINAAVFRVSGAKARDFSRYMTSQGHKVYDNATRRIVKPVPVTPEDADPSAPGPVTLAETLKIIGADKVHKIAQDMWGPPELGPIGRLAMKAARWLTGGKGSAPQPKVAVIDTGADTSHPMLKNVAVKNETSGENVDDIGHGSWVTGDVLNIARWLKSVTHYKTFSGGGATLEDILKSLTDAANDGNIVMSNSWGSDDGDPESPDSQLVRKLAQEGHIMVFAAGNSGPGKNTIGSPAIVYYKDAKTGALRVVSVAATNRGRKIASFSSRGPGSEKTRDLPDYPRRPDLASVGYNKESAWPQALGDADRTDPVYGPQKAISGTSMSTPDVAGAIALLAQLFNVTERGERLDAIVNAVMSTLENTGQGQDNEGQGFINVNAAYELLKKTMDPAAPGFIARAAARAARWISGRIS